MKFLKHFFGNGEVSYRKNENSEPKTYKTIDIALDYLQLLYQQPCQKLPILCFVSKENNTGKSTFANFLRTMLGANVAIVGNSDLSSDYNAHWTTKCVVICDETKIDKEVVANKVKSLSTGDKVFVNPKNKGQFEIDCFLKFVLISNNEDNFIYLSDADTRYWIIKVPPLKKESVNPLILDDLIEEMPAFLSFLNTRRLCTEYEHRMWFHHDLLKTDALQKVINYSQPVIQKEIRTFIRDMFFEFKEEEILMTRKALHKECFNNKYEANYLEAALKDGLKVKLYFELVTMPDGSIREVVKNHRHSYPKWQDVQQFSGGIEKQRVDIKDNGRPYVFKRADFLTEEEIESLAY